MSGRLRTVEVPFVVPGPSGVAVRTRLRVTDAEGLVLRRMCAHLGRLASADLAERCAAGLGQDKDAWASRKQALTATSSSRWAGALTRGSNDQWALARRAQVAHAGSLRAGIATIRHRLSLPVGEPGTHGSPGGYRSRREWHANPPAPPPDRPPGTRPRAW